MLLLLFIQSKYCTNAGRSIELDTVYISYMDYINVFWQKKKKDISRRGSSSRFVFDEIYKT